MCPVPPRLADADMAPAAPQTFEEEGHVTGEPLTATPTGDRRCACVDRHTPIPQELHRHHVWPLGEGGPDIAVNLRWICPTSHSAVHKLWREYQQHRTTPPWEIRRHYNRFVRDLVADGWVQAHPTGVAPA